MIRLIFRSCFPIETPGNASGMPQIAFLAFDDNWFMEFVFARMWNNTQPMACVIYAMFLLTDFRDVKLTSSKNLVKAWSSFPKMERKTFLPNLAKLKSSWSNLTGETFCQNWQKAKSSFSILGRKTIFPILENLKVPRQILQERKALRQIWRKVSNRKSPNHSGGSLTFKICISQGADFPTPWILLVIRILSSVWSHNRNF